MRILRIMMAALLAAAAMATAEARQTYRLDDGWRFYFSDENSGDKARTVTLPHTWSRMGAELVRAAANYDRTMYIPAEWQGQRLFLRFGGAQTVADVFVNGRHAGAHKGAYTAFAVEITDCVRYGAENLIHVVVSNSWRSDMLPAATDQNLGGGLTRSVVLEVTPRTAISPLYYGTSGVVVRQRKVTAEKAEAEAEIHVTAAQPVQCDVTLRVTDPTGYAAVIKSQRVKVSGEQTVTIPFAVQAPLLWQPREARLYRVTATVATDSGQSDTVEVTTGFKNISFTAGGGMRTGGSGRQLQMRGVRLAHDSYAHGAAMTRDDYDRDVALIRELGANAVRSEGGPHDAYLYERCDAEGIMAWIDLPLTGTPYLSDMDFYDTDEFRENGRRQLTEIILQNINHPSVAMWGIFSLIDPRTPGVKQYVEQLAGVARQLDPIRPTVACSNRNGDLNFVTDLIVWQQNIGWERGLLTDIERWCMQLRDGWSHVASGVTFGEQGHVEIRQLTPERVAGTAASEARQTELHEHYAAATCDNEQFWGVWVNSLADYASARHSDGSVDTGLVTADRQTRKDAFYLYKALWNRRQPTLHIVGRRVVERSAAPQRVTVYSSAGEPVMTVGGDTVKMYEAARCRYVSDEFRTAGRQTIAVSAGQLRDSVTINAASPLVRP